MDVLRIVTETPEVEQWRRLTQFTFAVNIEHYLTDHGFTSPDSSVVDYIAGSIRQGAAFFESAKVAPLDISPLLLYYGAANLMFGVWAMQRNEIPHILNHGMRIQSDGASRIADVEILPMDPTTGGLQVLASVFSPGTTLVGRGPWVTGELLGSIPDLKSDFEIHYRDLPYFIVPVEIVHTRELVVDRFKNSEVDWYKSPQEATSLMPDLAAAYLAPQFQEEYVILHRRMKAGQIGTYSVSGRKYLELGHVKAGQTIITHQLVGMYMVLYVLGFLPRYRPALWNPFVQRDQTGEKLIVEKFVAICQRLLPNLVLNFVYGRRVRFVNETDGIVDLSNTEEELRGMIRGVVSKMRETGDFR